MPAQPANPPLAPRETLPGDLWGGFAAMLVAMPSAIAYGVAIYSLLGPAWVGHGVRAGVLGAFAIGLIAPALGGAPRLISAPCAPAAAVLGALATAMVRDTRGAGPMQPEQIVVWLTLVAVLSAMLQLAYGVIGAGRLIKYIPYPVVSGYLSGVGVIIVVGQLSGFLGLSRHVTRLGDLAPTQWQWSALLVGSVTIAGVLVAPRVTKAVPATILGLLVGWLTFFGLGLALPDLRLLHGDHNPLVIGTITVGGESMFSAITRGWGAVAGLHASDVGGLVVPALTLSVLLSIDTLKTCVVVDALTRSRHDSNRELIGQGAGNLASAVIGGMPGAGTMGASLVNVNSGGRTRRSGVLEGVFVLAVFLVFGRLIAWVPIAALAGILFVVAFRMIDWRSFQLLKQRSTMLDFAVTATVVLVAVTSSLIAASGTGLGLAILLFIREQIRGSVVRRKVTGDRISSKQQRLPAEQVLLEQRGALTTVCELQGSLFFGTTDQLFTELEPDLATCRHLILDMRRVLSVDFTAAHMLEQFEAILKDRDGFLIFSRLPASLPTGQDLQTYFSQVGVTTAERKVRVFGSLDDALRWVEDRILADEGLSPVEDDAPLALAQIELLRNFEVDQTLGPLAPCVSERSYAPGEFIFKGGDSGDELFLVRRGNVRIVLPLDRGSYHNLASFGRGTFFGEMAFLDRGTRSADAVATTATDLFVISRARFDEVSRAHPLVGVKMFARLARALALRLRHTDAELGALYEA
jgi:sulfate permease, SulP family